MHDHRTAEEPGTVGGPQPRGDSSSAPLLFFVDSDTALAPDAVQNAVQAYRDTPDCGMVQGIYDKEPLFDDGPVERYRVFSEHSTASGRSPRSCPTR